MCLNQLSYLILFVFFSAIMSLSNALMYEGRLECGSERTASAVLQLPSKAQVEKELDLYVCEPQYSAWVQAALEPNNPVCFLDTSEVSLAVCFFRICLTLNS